MVDVELGYVVATAPVQGRLEVDPHFARWMLECLERHRSGDWGDVDGHDRAVNDEAAVRGDRVLSSYLVPAELLPSPDPALWIVTEWDRSATTLLWPSDY